MAKYQQIPVGSSTVGTAWNDKYVKLLDRIERRYEELNEQLGELESLLPDSDEDGALPNKPR